MTRADATRTGSGRRALAVVALALLSSLLMTACGKKGTLEPPPDATLYQNAYPAPDSMTESDEGET